MKNLPGILAVLAVLLVVGLFMAGIYRQYRDCAARDGVLLKGVFWYECVAAARQ